MKLTVNKYLNARVGSAATSAPCDFYQGPGNTITIDDILIGEEIDGNSIWYHSIDDGCFYWSGGIEELKFEFKTLAAFNGNKSTIINEAIKFYWHEWKNNIPGFTGAFAGFRNDQDQSSDCIVFQLSGSAVVPSKVLYKGFAIDTTIIQASFAKFEHASPGNSISRINEIDESGTATLKVYRGKAEDDEYYMLTNYHVAAFDLLRAGQFTYKFPPDIVDRQVMIPRQAVDPSNSDFIGAFTEGRLSPNYDVALVLLNDKSEASNRMDNFTIKDYIDVHDGTKSYVGKQVTLYGATSHQQTKNIISVHSHQLFSYSGNNKIDMLQLLQTEKYSEGGDSGSPVIMDKKIVAIHIGSDDKFSYAIPIKRVLKFFNLKISQI